MDSELLRTFLEVRATRHFGRAADSLCITQAAVSARVKQLEELFGAALFSRERNNIQLTEAGDRLVPYAETVMLALTRARRDVAGSDQGGPLRFVFSNGLQGGAARSWVGQLRAVLGDRPLRVEFRDPADIWSLLLERRIDGAVLYDPPLSPELDSLPLGELHLRLYSTRRNQSIVGAMQGRYVMLDWGAAFSQFHARRYGQLAAIRLQTNEPELALDQLGAEGGACYLTETLRRARAGTRLYPVRGAAEFRRSLSLTFRASAVHREQLEELLANAPALDL